MACATYLEEVVTAGALLATVAAVFVGVAVEADVIVLMNVHVTEVAVAIPKYPAYPRSES